MKPTKSNKRTAARHGTDRRNGTARRRAARKGSSQEQEESNDAAPIDFSKRPTKRTEEKANRRGTNAASLANLRKGATAPLPDRPRITDADADFYVKLRTAGVPVMDCIKTVMRLEKRPTSKQMEFYIDIFESDSTIADAYQRLNGAPWQDLGEDERTETALRMHIAQCAYVLYTSDIADPLCNMKKIEYAKTAIVEQIALAKETGNDDRFTQFMQELVNNATAGLPPTFKKENATLPALPADFVTKGKPS